MIITALCHLSGWLVGLLSPLRVRRSILISSLYVHLLRIDPLDLSNNDLKEMAKDIDNRFKLNSVDSRSARMGMLYHHRIWDAVGQDFLDVIDNSKSGDRLGPIVDMLYVATPMWLKYDPSKLKSDIRGTVGNVKQKTIS